MQLYCACASLARCAYLFIYNPPCGMNWTGMHSVVVWSVGPPLCLSVPWLCLPLCRRAVSNFIITTHSYMPQILGQDVMTEEEEETSREWTRRLFIPHISDTLSPTSLHSFRSKPRDNHNAVQSESFNEICTISESKDQLIRNGLVSQRKPFKCVQQLSLGGTTQCRVWQDVF